MDKQKHFFVTFHVQKDKRMTLGTAVHISRRCPALIYRVHDPAKPTAGRYYNVKKYQTVHEVNGPLLGQMLVKNQLCKRCLRVDK